MGRWLYKRLRYIFSSLLEIIYSGEKSCFICEGDLEGDFPVCISCDNYLPYLEMHSLIYTNIELENVYSIFKFEGKIKEIIYGIKYNKEVYLAGIIGDIMASFIESNKLNYDFIIPIPMHESKLQERGYNHAYLIAKRISRVTGIKLNTSLKKTQNTSSQVLLNGSERWYNVRGSFKSTFSYKNKNILLIDDVVTTGSTGHFSALELGHSNNVSLLTFASSKVF